VAAIEILRTNDQASYERRFEQIIGDSPALDAVLEQVERVAPTGSTVLIQGETGTGKELIAHAIHYNSLRAKKPFVKVSCAALPESLIESELFGYEKGAFTGAQNRKKGRFELAEGGTLFLDEIGDINLGTQVKLLRVLQEREFERLGGTETTKVNVRLIAATNQDMEKTIAEGTFREDLYYRLNVFTIFVPPLRDRQGDSLLLAQFILQQFSERFGKPTRGLAPDAIRAIQAHPWPGNVRELENRIKGAVIMAEGAVVTANDLGLEDPGDDPEYLNLRVARQRAESQAVRQSLAVARGNLSRAAELLGVTRPTLYDLLGKHGIDAAQFGRHGPQAVENPAPELPAEDTGSGT